MAAGGELATDAADDDGALRYDMLLRGGHTGRILGLASSIAKSILVSMSSDRSLRVWDLRRLECQFVAPLHADPLALSLHPDGVHLALAFEGRLHIHHVGLDALLPWRDLPLNGLRVCAYSNGGGMLAVNANTTIALYDSYSLQRIANLHGHLAPVSALCWAADDAAFTSGGADGMFYSWSVEKLARMHECRLFRGAAVTDVAVLSPPRANIDAFGEDRGTGARARKAAQQQPAGGLHDVLRASRAAEAEEAIRPPTEHTVLVVGGDDLKHRDTDEPKRDAPLDSQAAPKARADHPAGTLRMVERTDEQASVSLSSESLSIVVAFPGARVAAAAGASGTIFIVECAPAVTPGELVDEAGRLALRGTPVRPFLASVTALHASRDERLLFAGGANGALFVYERQSEESVRSLDPAGMPSTLQLGGKRNVGLIQSADAATRFTDVQCVSRETLEQAAHDLAHARHEFAQLQKALIQEGERSEMRIASTIAQQQRERAEEIEVVDRQKKQSVAEHNAEIASLHKRFAAFAAKKQDEARARQGSLETAMLHEIGTHEDVAAELQAVRERAATELATLSLQVKEAQELREHLDAQAAALMDDAKADFEEELSQFDEMAEAKQMQMMEEYDATLLQERYEAGQAAEAAATELKSMQMQQYMTRKKLDKERKDKEAREQAIRKKEAQAAETAAELAELKALVHKLRGEGTSRQKELSERDKKIVGMHTATQRLESTKQLLELRVKELEEVHEPMMVQLYELKMNNNDLEAELVTQGEGRTAAETEVGTLRSAVKDRDTRLKKAEQRAGDAESAHAATLAKMYQLVEERAAMATVAEFVRSRDRQLSEDQTRAGRPRKPSGLDDEAAAVVHEVTRQRDKMQHTIEKLSAEIQRDRAKARTSAATLGAEAQRVHVQLNDERRKNHELQQQLEAAQMEIEALADASERVGAKSRSPTASVLMLPPKLPPTAPSPAKGSKGMSQSATLGSLRLTKKLPGEPDPRPESAPGEHLTLSNSEPALTGSKGLVAPPAPMAPIALDMSEHVERHLLENQKLREALLHYTSGKAKGGKKGKKGASLTMPLPPV